MAETTQTPQFAYGVRPAPFRLPDAAHPGAVHLQVSDVPRALMFYERVLGLRAHRLTGTSAVLTAQSDDLPLVTLHTKPGVTAARPGAFGLYHFAILLPDRSALGRFAAHIASLNVRVGMADHLVSESLYLSDPDGLGIEVYADRPRDTWHHHDREVAMATDPLDIRSVVAAGRGVSWTGAPDGTTMGHVHLHVGSLERSEAFYHHALGFDKTMWNYPGALFMSAGGYHHHLGTNTWAPGPAPSPDHARLVEWELLVPSDDDTTAVAKSLRDAGYHIEHENNEVAAADPWGTQVRVRADR